MQIRAGERGKKKSEGFFFRRRAGKKKACPPWASPKKRVGGRPESGTENTSGVRQQGDRNGKVCLRPEVRKKKESAPHNAKKAPFSRKQPGPRPQKEGKKERTAAPCGAD